MSGRHVNDDTRHTKLFATRRNHFDITAGLIYSLGCFLVHFAMFLTIFTVQQPDVQKARLIDNDYYLTIIDLDPEYGFQ